MVVAAMMAAAALAGPADGSPSRDWPIPSPKLTLAHSRLRVKQGGQRVHVTIPVTPATNGFGDTLSYRWDTRVDGGSRCQPGALPDLCAVTAGTVIDAPLPMPRGGWWRGLYGVTLDAVITLNCSSDPPAGCRDDNPHGATEDADPFFHRAFRGHPLLQRHRESDDDTFYGYPESRAEAGRMAAIVDRLLRAGPYHGGR